MSQNVPDELRKAIHDGAREGVQDGFKPDWSFLFTDPWQRKFDALIAAVFEEPDDVRDRVLARAKAMEAEAGDDANQRRTDALDELRRETWDDEA